MEYLQLPLSFTGLFKTRELKRCPDLDDSIARNIQLILTTAYGDYAFDPTFGCNIWEHDFDVNFSNNQWQDKLALSVRQSLIIHEKRLAAISVKTLIIQTEVKQLYNNKLLNKAKRKVEVKVDGRILLTDVPYTSTHTILISPFSSD